MDPSLWCAFVLACALLCLIPGPNVALIVSNSVAFGPRYGLLTVAGTSAAMVPQLLLTGLGMAAVLTGVAAWLSWLRWIGAIYLVWLGIQQWRAPPTDLTSIGAQLRPVRGVLARAFLVSITNPKTLLFYGAFFPQFIDSRHPPGQQVALLSITFLSVAILVDGMWALLASRLRRFLALHGTLRNRLTGGLLIGAGVGLAAARK